VDHSVSQKNVKAGRDVAGRDIDNSLTINNQHSGRSPLASLIQKYNEELASGTSIEAIIEKLQHWTEPDVGTEVLGVKEKLQKGERPELVEFGLKAKELFTKCLYRHQHSRAAQEMCAYLLAAVWQKFNSVIRPRILEGVPNAQIDSLVQIELVQPIEQMLDTNPLQIDQSEISGMIYFLTGNCHLNWH
jgi:hypothetical protein